MSQIQGVFQVNAVDSCLEPCSLKLHLIGFLPAVWKALGLSIRGSSLNSYASDLKQHLLPSQTTSKQIQNGSPSSQLSQEKDNTCGLPESIGIWKVGTDHAYAADDESKLGTEPMGTNVKASVASFVDEFMVGSSLSWMQAAVRNGALVRSLFEEATFHQGAAAITTHKAKLSK
jgi:hypothetical protein